MNHNSPNANIATEVPGITHLIGFRVNFLIHKMIGNARKRLIELDVKAQAKGKTPR